MERATASGGRDAQSLDLRLSRNDLLLIFGFWTCMAVLTAANRTLDPRGLGAQPAFSLGPIALAFVESYVWAVLTPPLFWVSGRVSVEWRSRVGRVLLLVGLGVLVAALVVTVMELARSAIIPPPPRPGRPGVLWSLRRLWFLNDLIVYIAIIAAGAARAYSLRYRERRTEGARLEAEAAELRAQLAEARLDALRMQLDPHFLFNTLHAISSLVERDPGGVRRMISRLSELLRHTIEGPALQEIPLRAELELLRRYLDIMEIRFQGRLEVTLEVDDGLADALVPNFVLQPIVENAIKHGISKVDGVGRIVLRAARAGDQLVLRVWNNGPADGTVPNASGVGLRNTKARLEQLYGSAQRLTLGAGEEGGVVAEIRLPYHTESDLRTTGARPDV